jgi:hypothetical protein
VTAYPLPADLSVEGAIEILGDYLRRLGTEHDPHDPDDPWQERNRVTELIDRLTWQANQEAPVDPLLVDLDDRAAIYDNLPAPQPRERPVPCRQCHRDTMEVDAICGRCAAPGRAATETVRYVG